MEASIAEGAGGLGVLRRYRCRLLYFPYRGCGGCCDRVSKNMMNKISGMIPFKQTNLPKVVSKDMMENVYAKLKTPIKHGAVMKMDCSMFWLSAMRTMETDFGIIPYPKFDETQDNYYARISYFMPPLIPVTNQNLELTGAVLEVTNYLVKKHITPAYYDIALKGKYSRDEESAAMLDLIFENRLIELGDTIFCSDVRDGFFASMYTSDNRNLVSTVEKNEKHIQRLSDTMVGANQ